MYTIEIQGLDKLNEAIIRSPQLVFGELSKAIKTSVAIIRPIMRDEVPMKSGKLRRNIYAKATGLEGEVGPDLNTTPYALFVHEGTRAHEIRPTTKKALYWKGALHPVRKVMHPGTQPNPFVERTYNRIKDPIEAIFKAAIDRITAALAK